MDSYTWPFARLIQGEPMTEPECVAAGCPCACHDGEGDDCDHQGCSFWPGGQDPETQEPEVAAPPLEKP